VREWLGVLLLLEELMGKLFPIGLAGFVGTLSRFWISGVVANASLPSMPDIVTTRFTAQGFYTFLDDNRNHGSHPPASLHAVR
jgi:hypothetical protein